MEIKFVKRILLIGLLICSFRVRAFAQEAPNPQAWKVIYKTHIEAGPGATQAEKKKIQKFKQEKTFPKIIQIVSDSLYRIVNKNKVTIVNRRDSVIYTLSIDEKTAYKETFEESMDQKANPPDHVLDVQRYPDSVKVILGQKTEKITQKISGLYSSDKPIKMVGWCAINLPHWFVKFDDFKHFFSGLPELPLKIIAVRGHKRAIVEAVRIERISLKPSDYTVPEDYRIINQ